MSLNIPPGVAGQSFLGALFAPGISPHLPPLPPAGQVQIPGLVTIEQVNALIDARLQALQPAPQPDLGRLNAVLQQVDALAKRALSKEDYEAMMAYMASGGPGFTDLMASDALNPIVQLLCETIKERKP